MYICFHSLLFKRHLHYITSTLHFIMSIASYMNIIYSIILYVNRMQIISGFIP